MVESLEQNKAKPNHAAPKTLAVVPFRYHLKLTFIAFDTGSLTIAKITDKFEKNLSFAQNDRAILDKVGSGKFYAFSHRVSRRLRN